MTLPAAIPFAHFPHVDIANREAQRPRDHGMASFMIGHALQVFSGIHCLPRPSCCRPNGKQDIGKVGDQSDTNGGRNLGCFDDGSPSWVKCHAPSLVAVERQR
jgi:hypothetical protein